MKIQVITGREIFDSRGFPTIACDLTLSNGFVVTASVPAGASCGTHEAVELRDNEKRCGGRGVNKAVHNIDHIIAPVLQNKEPDVVVCDRILLHLDGTENKHNLGANAILAVSAAVCKAQAYMHNMELYECIAHLCEKEQISLPFPLFNIFNGGAHADNNFPIQEILIIPIGAKNFRTSLESSIEVFYELKKILLKKGKSTAIGDEGGFAPSFSSLYEPFDLIVEAIDQANHQDIFVIAIDVAASQLYDEKERSYRWMGGHKKTEDLFSWYKTLLEKYPLYSIEDGFSERDIQGWKTLYHGLGDKVQIVGDDLFVTQVKKIEQGIQEHLANASIIKPNQIGTITQTLDAIIFCQEQEMNTIISHRSGETEDTFIADLAVGTGAGQIKAGGCFRGERIVKYNRLLQIEDLLTMSLLDSL